MKKHRSTSPSLYFERQTHAKDPVVIEYVDDEGIRDGEAIAAILGAVVCGFALGMLLAATWAGVL